LVGRDGLVAEEDHRVLGQRAVQLVDGLVAERPAEVDAGDLRAEDRRELVDADALVRLFVIGDVLVARPGVAAHLRARHGVLRYSALIPAARITLPQLSISLAVKAANSSGVVKSRLPPSASSLATTSGELPAAIMSLFSLAISGLGVPLGA